MLGCGGILVGLGVLFVLGWMALDLIFASFGVLGTEGLGVLVDPLIWRETGQLLVVGVTVLGIYAAVFRPRLLRESLTVARVLLWSGSALCLAAWIRMPAGSRGLTWTLLLAGVGVVSPLLLPRLGDSGR